MWTRRQFTALASGLLVPGVVRARPAAAVEQKFLFLFNDGGWDTGYVFTPLDHISGAGFEDAATTAQVGGITFVDHEDRPAVRSFFEQHADRTAVLNGIEVRSVAHDRCQRLSLTGQGEGGDDWPSILAAGSASSLLMPHVIVDGPSFTDAHTADVVRVGDQGSCPHSCRARRSLPRTRPSPRPRPPPRSWRPRSWHAGPRPAARPSATATPRPSSGWQACAATTTSCCPVSSSTASGTWSPTPRWPSSCSPRASAATAMLRYKGWCSEGWDTHQQIERQSLNFGDLFGYLTEILADLDTRTSLSGGALADEVTIVVFSEMGREPRYNSWGGKDHWTFTSAMLVGGGIRGGQVIGGLDDQGQGQPVDLASGEATEDGTALLPEHLGATLLALGDIDPAAHADALPIDAVIA